MNKRRKHFPANHQEVNEQFMSFFLFFPLLSRDKEAIGKKKEEDDHKKHTAWQEKKEEERTARQFTVNEN